MTTIEPGITTRVAELREAFDRSFAEPPREQVAQHVDLLAVRTADRRYVLRLAQLGGLFPDRPVTALPGPVPALLGVAGFRGVVVPVYDLSAVLGGRPASAPRWLALAVGAPPVALAFDDVEGHLRVRGADLLADRAGTRDAGCLDGMVRLPGGDRPVVDLAAVRAAIRALTGHPTPDGGG